jgi:hypothetical protein
MNPDARIMKQQIEQRMDAPMSIDEELYRRSIRQDSEKANGPGPELG